MAGKGKFAPQQTSNSLVTGVIIFLLFVLGVWLFATPTQKIMDDAILKFDANLETETDHKVAVESRQVASTYSATSEPAPKDVELLSFTKFSDNPDLSTQDKESKIQKDFASQSPVEESPSPVPSSSKSASSTSSSSSSSSSTSSNSGSSSDSSSESSSSASSEEAPTPLSYSFPLCDSRDDVIPCLDNEKAIKALTSTAHYEHRERHCPASDEKLRCVLPLPEGYKPHINWPDSRDQIWYSNVPKPSLANYKADQNWVKAEGDKFVFPGGGTQFKFGATKYIEWLQESYPVGLSWGKHLRVGLDMGCGVASFAAYLDPFDVRMMSVAPKDEHDAQIQFALERGVSALVGVMGTMRQPYPANVFDAVHCARCRVPWHADGGRLLLELNRLIRPGGYFVWSATPVCPECKASEPDDAEVWAAMSDLTKKICWKRVQKTINAAMGIGVAIWQKPVDNECYEQRGESAMPPMCEEGDNPDAAWYVPMQSCLHKVPTSGIKQHGAGGWPTEGTDRLKTVPAWLKAVKKGVYGQPAYDEFKLDTDNWERVAKTYFTSAGIDWETVRNVMDMDAHYGGLGAALAQKPAWSMNVVPVGKNPDTLPAIFDRGLLGIYHDWCESFNTYPRTYDLLHADHLLGKEIKANRCDVADIMLEMDRILRPQGYVVLRESARFLPQIEAIAAALHWEVKKSYKQESEAMITYQKTMWRPTATS